MVVSSVAPSPHGGRLVDRQSPPAEVARRSEELPALPKLWPEVDQILDADKIGIGAYSPLDGFMDRETTAEVLRTSRLPSSVPWTLPILLTPPGRRNRVTIDGLRPGDDAALLDPTGRFVALLHLEEKHAIERAALADVVYGTRDVAHPNVADLQATGDIALSGKIDLVTRPESPWPLYEMTPKETRAAFARRGWGHVAAYQTRNVPHLAHEYLHRLTLEREEIDALFIHPVVGRLKEGDYDPSVVVRAYELVLSRYYPRERILFATLSIGMRYAGPKAALFLAIVRKNFGCSHYIVGRDQAGIDRRYPPLASQQIFDSLPVGIVPLRFAEAFHCRTCEEVSTDRTCPHTEEHRTRISQTAIRAAIAEGTPLPPNFLRPEVRTLLEGGGRILNRRVPVQPAVVIAGESRHRRGAIVGHPRAPSAHS